jgi:hypothetical protein
MVPPLLVEGDIMAGMDLTLPRPWPRHLTVGKGLKLVAQDLRTNRFSSTWLVKTSKNHDDTYLAEMTSSGVWKTSHHNEGGAWRTAMTREGAVELGVERQVADEWPQPVSVDGWTEGVSVLIPKRYLGVLSKDLKANVVVVPMSDDHNGIVIRIFFEDSDAVTAGFPAAFPIAVLDRTNDGLTYVLAEPVLIEEPQLRSFEAMCHSAREHIPREQLQERNRFVGLGAMDERRLVIDLCVDPD